MSFTHRTQPQTQKADPWFLLSHHNARIWICVAQQCVSLRQHSRRL